MVADKLMRRWLCILHKTKIRYASFDLCVYTTWQGQINHGAVTLVADKLTRQCMVTPVCIVYFADYTRQPERKQVHASQTSIQQGLLTVNHGTSVRDHQLLSKESYFEV